MKGVEKDRMRGSVLVLMFSFFFFKQKTAYEIYQCDWSSDVCSSDLPTDSNPMERSGVGPSLYRRQPTGYTS